MKMREADALGRQVAALLSAGETAEASRILVPILEQRVPFDRLGRIGVIVGKLPAEHLYLWLEQIGAIRAEGSWVVIGSALSQHIEQDIETTIQQTRRYIVMADIWYGADIFAERVPGPALVTHFQQGLELLEAWLLDENHWVRRAVGVSTHFWAKRSRGDPGKCAQATDLLDFVEPLFGEWQMDAAKGIGWGLKTLGRYYPVLTADWLISQVSRRHRSVVLRKAIAYLPPEERTRVLLAANA